MAKRLQFGNDTQTKKEAPNLMGDYLRRKRAEGVNAEYIQNFFNAASDYLKESEKLYPDVTWGNASSVYGNISSNYNALKERANKIRAWADLNKNNLREDSYNSIISNLDVFNKGGNTVLDVYKSAKDYYGTFGSAKDAEDNIRYHQANASAKDDPNFESIALQGTMVQNPNYNDTRLAIGGGGIFDPDLEYDNVGNWITFAEANRQNALEKMGAAMGSGGSATWTDHRVWMITEHTTEEERKTYNYLIGKNDKKAADEYLAYLDKLAELRYEEGLANQIDQMGAAGEIFMSVFGGMMSAVNGIANLGNFITGDDFETNSILSAIEAAEANNTGALGVATNIGHSVGNMIPSIMVGAATGGVGGAITMGASAMGNAYGEMKSLGYSDWEARGYGLLVGASEGFMQYAFGGISKLGGKVSKGALARFTSGIDNAFARVAVKLGGSMASEGLEEAIQTALEPAYKALITGEDYEAAEWGDIMYSALLGAITSGVIEGVGVPISEAQRSAFGRSLNSTSLVDEGMGFSADTTAGKLAQKYNDQMLSGKKLSGTQRANLYEAMDTEYQKADKAKLKKSILQKLGEYGEKTDVTPIADVLVKYAMGEKLSSSDQKILNNSTAGHKVMTDLNKQNIMSGSLDNNWAESIGTKRISPELYSRASQGFAVREAVEKGSVAKTLSQSNTSMGKDFKASKSGTTIYKDPYGNSEDVAIKKIVSTDGGIKVKLNNGKTVSASELFFSSSEEALMYEMVARMETTPETANEIINIFKPANAKQASLFFASVPLTYLYGKMNYEAGLENISLSEQQKRLVYNRGRMDAMTKAGSKPKGTASQKDNTKKPTSTKKNGIIYENGFTYDEATANELQKKSMIGIEVIDKMSNLEVHVFASKVVNGKRVAYVNGKRVKAPNGYFKDGNKIYIDINAGNGGEGAMLYTMSHEVTHYIRRWNEKGFKELSDFLIEQYGKKGVPVNALLEDQLDKIKRRYKEEKKTLPSEAKLADMAYEELVADAMSDMFTDPKAYEKLAKLKQQNKTLWQKLGEAIKALLDKLKTALGIYKTKDVAVAQEAMYVRDFSAEVYEKLQDLYIKAFVEADANYEASNASDLAEIDTKTESVSPIMNSERTWTESEYVTARDEAAEKIANALGVTKSKALKYIDDVNSIARIIANDRARLDYEASSFGSAFVSNVEYGGSFDYTTLCKKRRIYTGTFTEIQKRLKDTALTPDDILTIRNMLIEAGVEATCGLCYVEGSRANMGKFAKEFIRLYKRDNPLAWIPNMADVNTPDGVEQMRISHPEAYEQYVYFWNHYGKLKDSDPALFASQQKPKLYEARKEYKGEIIEHFKEDSSVSKKNLNGGIRMQSFSAFEIVHLIDTMQVIMDMSTVGLAGQAYTKVPEFAKAFGNTGLKINLSLIAKGVDADGKLIFDDREGMSHKTAFELRDRYSKNVGTIIVTFTDEQLLAAMADPRIDFIIPFHRSQWKKGQYGAMGLPKGTKDYTYMQNEKLIKKTYHEYRGRMVLDKASNYMPNEYWDFSKSGKENAEAYLKMCAENNKRPKFYKLLDYDGKGTYSLKADGSTDGYWKLLIDFKMYDNDGIASPQEAVAPTFNMDEAKTMLDEYKGGHASFPVAHAVVDKFVEQYEGEGETKFSDRDSDYMDAVNRGDMETAQRMVDEAAISAGAMQLKDGVLKHYYHGTNAVFTSFDAEKARDGTYGFGFYFSPMKSKASEYGELKDVYLMTDRIATRLTHNITADQVNTFLERYNIDLNDSILKYADSIEDWVGYKDDMSILLDLQRFVVRSIDFDTKKLLNNFIDVFGYDGVRQTNETVLWDNRLIKSADTVTYDDNGNIIPLSERFNTENNDIRYSDRDSDYEDYSKPITIEDVEVLRSIGRKNINEFSSEDIKKSQKWAHKFYRELGTKSPFFRAWFGDWRAYDEKTRTKVIDTKQDNRKSVVNKDTDWKIQTSKQVHKETTHHSGSAEKNAVKYLPYIDDITRNAVLFSSEISDKDNPNSLMFHIMYAYTEVMGYPALLKLKIEELFYHNFTESGELMRDYILQNVEEESVSERNRLSRSNHSNTNSSDISIADLYKLVKTYDKEFKPKSANPLLLDENHQPKVFYHGTDAEFSVFDIEMAGQNWHGDSRLGKGFYFANTEREALQWTEGTKVVKAYLKLENPLDVDAPTPKNIAKEIDKYIANKIASFDENNSFISKEQYIKNLERIKDMYMNDVSMFINEFKYDDNGKMTDGIREFLSSLHYDGIISKDEVVAFYPSQIKSATDNIGTFNEAEEDIYYSDRDSNGNTLSKEQQEFFKDSKVRDESGNLRVVYHGTDADFTVFDADKDLTGEKYYFAASRTWVKKLFKEEKYHDPKNIMRVYLNIKNPLDLRSVPYSMTGNEWIDYFDSIGVPISETFRSHWSTPQKNTRSYGKGNISAWALFMFDGISGGLRDTLSSMGYDGLIIYDRGFGKADNTAYVCFEKNQIKLTTNKSPTFDPDIRYSDRDSNVVSNRTLLANALDSALQNDIEKKKLDQYKSKIAIIEAEQIKLNEKRAKANEIRFKKGRTPAETKQMRALDIEARQIENRINTYDKQLLSLESTLALKKVLEREKNTLRKRLDQKGREMLTRYRERGEMSELRSKIKYIKRELESTLLRPTQSKYVPDKLVKSIVDVCNLINTDTAHFKADGSINKAQAKRDETRNKLDALLKAYEDLKKADPLYSSEFDEFIASDLENLRETFDGKVLSDLNIDQLREIYETLRSITETLADARKLIGFGQDVDVYEAGDEILAEQANIRKKRKNKNRNLAQYAVDGLTNLSLAPVRSVERMSDYNQNSYLVKLFKEFEKGVRKKNKFYMDSHKFFEELTTGENLATYDDAVYKTVGNEYTDVNGKKFRLTKMQMMQAVLSYERETADETLKHIVTDGFSFADVNKLKSGNIKEAISAEHSHRLAFTPQMMTDFLEQLSDEWSQRYMQAARVFFNENAKDAINETMIALKHHIVANSRSYIPFEVDKSFVAQEISAEQNIQQTINSYGMLKETKPNAIQPLIISGLNNVIERHIELVSNVYGLAIPVRNFNKVWNLRGDNFTVKGSIETTWGEGGRKLIEQTVKDLQGSRVTDYDAFDKVYQKLKSGYITAKFMFNLSVVLKQVGSLFTARSMIGHRSSASMISNLVYTMAHFKEIAAEVDKYTATAWMRRQGMSDGELSTLMTQAKKSRIFSKIPAGIKPSKWINAMDSAVALSLWKYCKEDTAKRTGLEGEELMKATAEYYDTVIENTQSMSDVLHRPEIQKRRSNVLADAFSMFKTDLFQTAGQLRVSFGRFVKEKSRENLTALLKTGYSAFSSAIWGVAITSLIAALRYKMTPYKDEDDELTIESWLEQNLFDLSSDLFAYIFPTGGGEIADIIENIIDGRTTGELVDSVGLTAINDLYTSILRVVNKENTTQDDWINLIVKALELFGVPANNIKRTIDAIKSHAKDISRGKFFSFESK